MAYTNFSELKTELSVKMTKAVDVLYEAATKGVVLANDLVNEAIGHVEGEIVESDLAILRKGVVVDGVRYGKSKVKALATEKIKTNDGERTLTRLEVIITEGKNREVRRMFEAVEKNVVFLKRVAIGDLRLGGLSRGGNRELNDFEVAYLQKL